MRSHSGVCHSDLGVMTNSWAKLPFPTPEGQVGGHEGVGKIVKLGPGAETQGVKVGDRVGIKWMSGICGNCGTSVSFFLVLLAVSRELDMTSPFSKKGQVPQKPGVL
jgi:Zn-dependent alcohol dehydrogenase